MSFYSSEFILLLNRVKWTHNISWTFINIFIEILYISIYINHWNNMYKYIIRM